MCWKISSLKPRSRYRSWNLKRRRKIWAQKWFITTPNWQIKLKRIWKLRTVISNESSIFWKLKQGKFVIWSPVLCTLCDSFKKWSPAKKSTWRRKKMPLKIQRRSCSKWWLKPKKISKTQLLQCPIQYLPSPNQQAWLVNKTSRPNKRACRRFGAQPPDPYRKMLRQGSTNESHRDQWKKTLWI